MAYGASRSLPPGTLRISSIGQTQEAVEPFEDQRVKGGLLKEDRERAEKRNEFFAPVFTVEATGHRPVFPGKVSED